MLETDDLLLVPYTPAQLVALIDEPAQFEQLSGFSAAEGLRSFIVSDEVSPHFLERLRALSAPDPWLLGFVVVHREARCAIGNAGFTGPPDRSGSVEIGYGIVPAFEGRGYATQAARALTRFAFDDARVDVVRAHTLPQLNASTHVLAKCGYAFVGEIVHPEDGRVWRWETRRPDASETPGNNIVSWMSNGS
ncbi:MAG TPA: GNAT family N-acetyltransferase [Gemmatimonadaceae bacterium]|nr:GNAT family N-acetyltransferase [Gemmatimonadaceae bacterium]